MRSNTEFADELRERVVSGSDQSGDRDGNTEHGWRDDARDGWPESDRVRAWSRYHLAAFASAAAAGLAVYLVARRVNPHQRILTRSNVLTLSRVAGASLLAGTAAAPSLGRRAGLLALIWGGASDWLDGPLARRDGPTAFGALLDIEADSWLTLWAAIASCRTRALPTTSLLPPLLRYAIPAVQAWRKSARPRDRLWQRAAAGLQNVTLLLALAPAGRLQRIARVVAPIGTIAQSVAMASTVRDLLRADSRA